MYSKKGWGKIVGSFEVRVSVVHRRLHGQRIGEERDDRSGKIVCTGLGC